MNGKIRQSGSLLLLVFGSLISLTLSTGCISRSAKVEANSAATTEEVAKTQQSATEAYSTQTQEGISLELKNKQNQSIAEVASQAAHGKHDDHAKGVEPGKAYGWLKNGNTRFVKGHLRKDGQSPKDIKKLSAGQKPHTIVLSCSDSRVPPELVFDQKLGELFVVRTAGEALESTSIASIEYAIEHLGSRLILVMGHTSCGAIKAAMATIDGADAGSPHLNRLVADIHPRVQEFKNKTPSQGFQKESWANAKGVAKDLATRSTLISNRLKAGDLEIKTALYHLDSGKVDFE